MPLFKKELTREIHAWFKEGVISQEQAVALGERYQIDPLAEPDRSPGYRILVVLGYLFAALALIILIGENWDSIPRPVRMGGLILLTVVVQALGVYQQTQSHKAAAITTFFLGNACFGSSIILIAQIYHLGEHMPDGIFWWTLGTLPFALLMRSRLLLLQFLFLAMLWFFLEAGMGFYPVFFPLFLLVACYSLFLTAPSLILFFATLSAAYSWAIYSLGFIWGDSGRFSMTVELLAVMAGFLVFSFSLGNRLNQLPSPKARLYGRALTHWVPTLALLPFLILSFEEPWKELLRAKWMHWQALLGLLSLMMGCSIAINRKHNGILAVTYTWIALIVITSLVITIAYMDITAATAYQLAQLFQVVTNIAIVIGTIMLIITSFRSQSSYSFFLGITGLLLLALLRYFDLIGNYIGGALLFALFSLILLFAANFWKRYQGATPDTYQGAD